MGKSIHASGLMVVVSILITTMISVQNCVHAYRLSARSSTSLLRCHSVGPRNHDGSNNISTSSCTERNTAKMIHGHQLRAKTVVSSKSLSRSLPTTEPLIELLSSVRGGGGGIAGGETAITKPGKKVSPKKKKKKKAKSYKRKKLPSSSSSRATKQVEIDGVESSKSAIREALKEDAATAMGDAIR